MASYPPYQPPNTPEEIAREQERIRLILEINSEILEHVNRLQAEGQGGALPGAAPVPGSPTQDKPASSDFVTCLRATQVNVAYLAIACQGGGTGKNRGTPRTMMTHLRVGEKKIALLTNACRDVRTAYHGRPTDDSFAARQV